MTDEEYEDRVGRLRRFRRWVTHDVLPSIRQYGLYATDDVSQPDPRRS